MPLLSQDPTVSQSATTTDATFEAFLAEVAAAPAQPVPIRIGEVLVSRYVVTAELGRGGMGTVYLAYDRELHRNVAIKRSAEPSHPASLARLRHEARAMAQLNHAQVATVYEVGTHHGHVFIAMEYIPGGTLRDRIGEIRSWTEAIDLLIPLANGLAAAHAAGIIHRDFKPENVLLTTEGRPRIVDFGLAQLTEADDRSPTEDQDLKPIDVSGSCLVSGTASMYRITGTPAYMAPERFSAPTGEPASDQYAFCIVAFEALYGQRPFLATTLLALRHEVCEGNIAIPVPPRLHVPKRLRDAIVQGLSVEPSQRFASMAALAAELERIRSAPRRRRRALLTTATLAATAFVGFQAALFTEPGPCEIPDSPPIRVPASVSNTTRTSLDAYASAIANERRHACQALNIDKTISADGFELRIACLNRMQARLDGLIDALSSPETDTSSINTDHLLPPLAQCQDAEQLRFRNGAHRSASFRASTDADAAHLQAYRLLSRAHIEMLAGKTADSPTIAQAERLAKEHHFDDILARVYALQASLTIDLDARESLLRLASQAAVRTRDLRVLANIRTRVAALLLDRRDFDRAEQELEVADQLIQMSAPDDPVVDHVFRQHVALRLARAQGRNADVLALAPDIIANLDVSDHRRASVLAVLGNARIESGDFRGGKAALELALNPQSPKSSYNRYLILISLAYANASLGAFDTAQQRLLDAEQTLADCRDVPPATYAELRLHQGTTARQRGALDDAERLLTQAQDLLVGTNDDALIGFVLDQLGSLYLERHELDRAASAFTEAYGRLEAVYGPEDSSVAEVLVHRAEADLQRGQLCDANEHAQIAQAALNEQEGFEAALAGAEFVVAQAQVAHGEIERAITHVNHAKTLCQASQHIRCQQRISEQFDPWLATMSANDQPQPPTQGRAPCRPFVVANR